MFRCTIFLFQQVNNIDTFTCKISKLASIVEMGKIRFILKFLAYSNIYIVAVVLSLTLQSYWLLELPIDYNYILFLGCATGVLYPGHRLIGAQRLKGQSLSERFAMVDKHRASLLVLVAVFLVGTLYFFSHLDPEIQLLLLPGAAISVGYAIPFFPVRSKWYRLRDIPLIKIVLIALVVTWTTAALPTLIANVNAQAWSFFLLARFVLILAVTIPFDIRDLVQDKHDQLLTLPQLMGWERARAASLVLLTTFSFLNFALYFFFDFYSLPLFIALLLSDQYSAVMIRKCTPEKGELFYSFGIEGVFIVQALLVFAATLF